MIQLSFIALGTLNTIMIPECCDRGIAESAEERVMEIHNKLSVFYEDSEIYKINACAGKAFVMVSSDTMEILKRAKYFSWLTNGAFDITAYPLIQLWSIGRKKDFIPNCQEILEAKSHVNQNDLILDEKKCRARLRYSCQGIDLGGIAKGYAADEVKRILIENGVNHALINLGGNVMTIGTKNDGTKWKIGIQNPNAPKGNYIGFVEVENQTVVTSGTYERFYEKKGKRYHHIIDPRTGEPANSDLLSVTVIGDCSMDMDALTTALLVLGIEKSIPLLEKLNLQAIFITNEFDVLTSKKLRDSFHPAEIIEKRGDI